MRKLILIFVLISGISCFSQKEASNWYFGNNAGLHFNTDGSVTALTNGNLSTIEGCASISDTNGNLQFYTDGITVYNKNHAIMESGLYGDPSSTQSAIIVPKPNDPNIYFIFTIDTSVGNNDPDFGFNYSIVDITLNGGLGGITLKNSNLLQDSSEKISAVVKDCISQSIWVITFASPTGAPTNTYNTFHAFEVNSLGINTTPVSTTFLDINIEDQRGYLKLSPDGTKIACASARNGLYLYDFDASTGIVSNQTKLSINGENTKPYGVEFSPNSQLLYIHTSNDFFDSTNPSNNNIPSNHTSSLIQYNLFASDINTSATIIDNKQLYRGGLQLGPDGKIYRALSASYNSGTSYLGVIKDPNNLGQACNYQHNAINLSPNTSSQGLPPFITSFFSEKIDIINNSTIFSTSLSLCNGDTYTLTSKNIPGATYIWKRNDIVLPESNFDLIVTQEGLYEVFIDPNTGDCDTNLEGQAHITYNSNPIAYDYTLVQCDEDGIFGGFTRFNLNEAASYLTDDVSGLSAKFYTDMARLDEITNPNSYNYDTDNPQLIYIKVINDTTGCFDTSELTLEVSTTQINNFTATPLCDEINSENGINTFNLDDVTSEIQSINNIGFPITYYETYENALLEQNDLGTSFTNTNYPYSQTIHARIENANDCYGISEILLTVNRLPEIEIENLTYYCLNNYPKTITLNAGIINDSPSNYTYSWSTSETDYEIKINETGTYNVTVTNNITGCSKEGTITVEASNIASYENINVVDVTKNNTIIILVSGEGIYEYQLLDKNNNMYIPYQESNTFENIAPGIYTVVVSDIKNNCGEVPQKVSVIGFPKVFTPNGDGYNDTWQVQGVSSMFQPNSKILIFNRFGKLIKELNPLGKGWNGLFNGDVLPSDDYWFSVTLQDGRIFKNHFTLKH